MKKSQLSSTVSVSLIKTFNVVLGAYPCLEFSLELKRSVGISYVMTIVFPSIVIVLLSWFSFFVPGSLLTAKLCIALTTALSSLAMHILCRAVLAPVLKHVSYVTVMDIWMTCCLLFVVCALVVQLIVVSRASNQQQSQVQSAITLKSKAYVSSNVFAYIFLFYLLIIIIIYLLLF